MKALSWSIGGLIGVAGLGALCLWMSEYRPPQQLPTASLPSSDRQPAAIFKRSDLHSTPTFARENLSADYRKLFADSHDYWALANSFLSAAKQGNADAQYYVSRAMEYCADANRVFFKHGNQSVDLDQALQNAVRLHRQADLVQLAYDRCHNFFDHDSSELGSAAEWLAEATRAGQPLAQSVTALKLVSQGMLDKFASAGGVQTTISDPARVDADPNALLYAAVQSRDPEVLYNVGELYPPLNPDDPSGNVVRFAWILLACERGLDCSSNSDWVKGSCYDWDSLCNSVSGPTDVVRFLSGSQWSEVEQRAREIGNELDQGHWDKLGLGS